MKDLNKKVVELINKERLTKVTVAQAFKKGI